MREGGLAWARRGGLGRAGRAAGGPHLVGGTASSVASAGMPEGERGAEGGPAAGAGGAASAGGGGAAAGAPVMASCPAERDGGREGR